MRRHTLLFLLYVSGCAAAPSPPTPAVLHPTSWGSVSPRACPSPDASRGPRWTAAGRYGTIPRASPGCCRRRAWRSGRGPAPRSSSSSSPGAARPVDRRWSRPLPGSAPAAHATSSTPAAPACGRWCSITGRWRRPGRAAPRRCSTRSGWSRQEGRGRWSSASPCAARCPRSCPPTWSTCRAKGACSVTPASRPGMRRALRWTPGWGWRSRRSCCRSTTPTPSARSRSTRPSPTPPCGRPTRPIRMAPCSATR